MPLKRIFNQKFLFSMKIVLTKRNVARISQALTLYKEKHPESMQPMADCFKELTKSGAWLDSAETREYFLRTARLLGWPVNKTGCDVYENGSFVWGIDGR